jgi:hypothetical protein
MTVNGGTLKDRRNEHMDLTNDPDVADVINEATHPGKIQRKTIAVERRRKFKAAARMLRDSQCTIREYTDAIREIEPQENSPEFVRAVELWYKIRGKA